MHRVTGDLSAHAKELEASMSGSINGYPSSPGRILSHGKPVPLVVQSKVKGSLYHICKCYRPSWGGPSEREREVPLGDGDKLHLQYDESQAVTILTQSMYTSRSQQQQQMLKSIKSAAKALLPHHAEIWSW